MTSNDTENYLDLLKIYIFLLLYVHDECVGGRLCMPLWVCGGQGTTVLSHFLLLPLCVDQTSIIRLVQQAPPWLSHLSRLSLDNL